MNRMLAPLLLAAAATTCAHASSIVFNNTATPLNVINPLLAANQVHSLEHGNQVTLAGSDRMVTHLSVRFRISNGWSNFKAHARLYKNDGPDGKPGTLLWYSGPQNTIVDSGIDIPINFVVPNVRVPQNFTFTVQATDRWGVMTLMGPSDYNPPTVGSAPFGYWSSIYGEEGTWEYIGLGHGPFGAKIEANPIPGDVDHDGTVDIDDLFALLGTWGTCRDCPEDVDADGDVDIDDLFIVIANWS